MHKEIVPARDESVHISLSEPLSLVDRASSLSQQGQESNSSNAVDSFVGSLQISQEDQMSIENMTKGQFSNQKYRQYRRCMVTGSIIHQVNSRMRSIQSGKASDANRLVGMCMGTGKSFGGNAATSHGHANENKTAKSYMVSLADLHQDLQIHECGLLVYKDYSFIGGSMDRTLSNSICSGRVGTTSTITLCCSERGLCLRQSAIVRNGTSG